MAKKGAGNFTAVYRGTDVSGYINQMEYDAAVAELEATVANSTSTASDPGLPTVGVNLQGDLSKAVQLLFAVIPTDKGNLVVTTGTGAELLTRTWTASGATGAFHTGYKETHPANGKATFSVKLNVTGLPVIT